MANRLTLMTLALIPVFEEYCFLYSNIPHFNVATPIAFQFEGGVLAVGHIKDDWFHEILHLYTLFNGQLTVDNKEDSNQMSIQFGYYQLVQNSNRKSFDLLIQNCVICRDVLNSDFNKYITSAKEYKIMADNRLLTVVQDIQHGFQLLATYETATINPNQYLRLNNYYSLYYDHNTPTKCWYFKREGDVYWIKSEKKPMLLYKYIQFVFRVEYIDHGQFIVQDDQEGCLLDEVIVRYLYLINNLLF